MCILQNLQGKITAIVIRFTVRTLYFSFLYPYNHIWN